jgi:hypothetical protein
MNLAKILHENIQKNQRLDEMESGEIEVTQAERDELDNWWIERADDLNEALEAAGILVMGYLSPGWFPHPEWLYRVSQLGLSDDNVDMVVDYVQEHWWESLILFDDLEADGIKRAIIAYAKRCKANGITYNQPDVDLSDVDAEDLTGRGSYLLVVLRNVHGVLARFEAFPKWKDHKYAGFGLRYVEPGRKSQQPNSTA